VLFLGALLTKHDFTMPVWVARAITAAFAFADPRNTSKDETEIGR
jgi:hypothetical protein